MSETDDTRRFEDLGAAYALGALTPEERQEFEAHLAERPDMQAEVEDLGALADLLALAPQEHEPSPELRSNILRGIGAAPEDHPPAWGPPGRRRHALWRSLGRGGLAAAASVVVAVVGLLAWSLFLQNTNDDLRNEVAERQREAEVLREEEQSRSHELQGSGAARNARGEVLLTSAGRAVLVVEGLPPAPEGMVYEAWVMRDGVPEPAGLFEPQGGAATAPVEGSVKGAQAVAVTVEPDGGSPTPTSDPILVASMA